MKMVVVILNFIFLSGAWAALPPDPDFDLCARYTVWLPDTQKALEPYNDYLIKNYKIDRSVTDHERMLFNLPVDLTAGKPVPVILTVVSNVNGNREFDGPAGKASCAGPWKKMTCNFHFNPLIVDPVQSRAYLTQIYGDTPKRDALFTIASRFGGEPIGVAVMAPRDARCFVP